MKSSNLFLASVLCLLIACSAFASSPPWTGSGTYTFDDLDPYFVEDGIWDTATVNISGGSFGALHSRDSSTVNMFGGNAELIAVRVSSTLNMWGGSLDFLGVELTETITVNLFVDSYMFNPDSYLTYDQITGVWMNDNGTFDILITEGKFQYINMVPEPATLLLLATGSLFLRK